MEDRTQAVDRLLMAVSPALSAELERILAEARQALQADFDASLQAAVRDTETAARAAADARHTEALQRAIDATSESVRKQVTDELQARFDQKLEETVSTLKSAHGSDFQRARSEWNTERDDLNQLVDQWRVFAEAQVELMGASSQPEILMRWLKLAEPFASSIAIYTVKSDGLALWKSRGPAVFPDIISSQSADPESFFQSVVVRGKTVAAVCALPPYRQEALDFLSASMERAIELFGLKLRTPAHK